MSSFIAKEISSSLPSSLIHLSDSEFDKKKETKKTKTESAVAERKLFETLFPEKGDRVIYPLDRTDETLATLINENRFDLHSLSKEKIKKLTPHLTAFRYDFGKGTNGSFSEIDNLLSSTTKLETVFLVGGKNFYNYNSNKSSADKELYLSFIKNLKKLDLRNWSYASFSILNVSTLEEANFSNIDKLALPVGSRSIKKLTLTDIKKDLH